MSIEFKALVVGPLEANCFLVWDTDSLDAALIDPGDDIQGISDAVHSLSLKVKYVLLTHGHPDHCFVAGNAVSDFGAELAMHEADIEQVEQGMALAEMFYNVTTFVPFSPSILLADGQVLQIGKSVIQVIHTPGHSQGGLCFVTEVGVFCGDTIFAGSIGRTDFPGGSHEQLITSIKTKLLTMKDETPLYPGHGPSTTVGRERASNPFLS